MKPTCSLSDTLRRTSCWTLLGALFALGTVAGLGAGCAGERERTEAGAVGQGVEPVSATLDRVAAAHRALDTTSEEEARRVAAATLAALVAGPAPAALPREQWTALAGDAAAHLSTAALARGDAKTAIDWAARGLAFGGGASVFRAELFLAKGRAERSLGRADAASASLFAALKVNQELLDRELEHP